MTYELITNRNMTEGLQVILIYVNDITQGLFMRMMLLALWCIVCFGSFFIAKRNIGTGDFPVSFMIASFVTFIFAMILRLQDGLIDGFSIAIIIVLNLIGIALLMFDDETA